MESKPSGTHVKHVRLSGLAFLGAIMAAAQNPTPVGEPRIHAPDFTAAERWLNTDKPIRIADLRGQVVLLDFWTYCCINCMHIFPDLKFLEEKYKDQPFVVIGVHSGKFQAEKDAENIRQAVLRHNIAHPVAVDSEFKVWNQYAVRAWPTLVLIDPAGYVSAVYAGEGHRESLDREISRLLDEHRSKGTLAKPMTFRRERETFRSGLLEYPGKVLADPRGKRLFISDTNHHRVLMTDLDGRIAAAFGDGTIGLRDGDASTARFHQPQGLALSADGRTLFVADTENHALRAIDLDSHTVRTLSGNGRQSREYVVDGPGESTELSSPWDVCRVGDRLYIASAGTHQIWAYDLNSRRVRTFAGTGREAAVDGPLARCAFAQPSGLATDGKRLFVADAEVSSIRAVDLAQTGKALTLAGSGDLFDFGLKDGVGSDARFQHPLGVALDGDTLYVADTFNSRIRTIDLMSRRASTWFGDERRQTTSAPSDGPPTPPPATLFEPGGLSIADGVLYVADTNHHRILAIDLKTKASRVLDVK